MGIFDFICKIIRFKKESDVIRRIKGKAEYCERTLNDDVVEQDVIIDGESVKTSLNAKLKYIEAYAEKERLKREKEVAKADKKGKPLSVQEVKEMRDTEEKKRFEAFKHIRNFYGR